ncbi:mitochondrial ATP synthase g subunit-domain-containing protein [Mycotypha africana]|uniref:mitochondrial ATP synthase g subunit-domain-containing protein n=1 Tax=Mycotypha africana TaxID=64632 RepID=UPI002301A1EA|nr:mitochondrial ATP synthase g subunit-domain-containing protein [Mycotypha africana]KAI8991553.1 mitochondrial ATP synthase g subunit-domain-containing protein [Mycotypha africana]
MATKYLSCAQHYLNKLIALKQPVCYNAKVAAEIVKQVYTKEGMAFPTGAQLAEAQKTIEQTLKIQNLRNLTFKDAAKGGVLFAEIYTFFLIGEIVGRRNLVGYNVKTSTEDAAHAH